MKDALFLIRCVIGGAFYLFLILCFASAFPFDWIYTLLLFTVFVTSCWTGYDAACLRVERYDCQIAEWRFYGLFFGCLLLWPAVFPSYLYYRKNILQGRYPRRDGGEGELD